jgi:hypothetical protein
VGLWQELKAGKVEPETSETPIDCSVEPCSVGISTGMQGDGISGKAKIHDAIRQIS